MPFSLMPFAGWRYDLSRVGSLADIVASPREPGGAAAASSLPPLHAERLLCRSATAADPEQRAARLAQSDDCFHQWRRVGVLQQEHESAYYVIQSCVEAEQDSAEVWSVIGVMDLRVGHNQIVCPQQQMTTAEAQQEFALQRRIRCEMDHQPIRVLLSNSETDAAEQQLRDVLQESVRELTPVTCAQPGGRTTRIWSVVEADATDRIRQRISCGKAVLTEGLVLYLAAQRHLTEAEHEGEVPVAVGNLLCCVTAADEASLQMVPRIFSLRNLQSSAALVCERAQRIPGVTCSDGGSGTGALQEALELARLSQSGPGAVVVLENRVLLLESAAGCESLLEFQMVIRDQLLECPAEDFQEAAGRTVADLLGGGEGEDLVVQVVSLPLLPQRLAAVVQGATERDLISAPEIPSGLVYHSLHKGP